MSDIIKHYNNGEITVVWQPAKCQHSENCWRGLTSVFDLNKKPWIDVAAADTESIVAQVNKCPSGALSIERVNKGQQA